MQQEQEPDSESPIAISIENFEQPDGHDLHINRHSPISHTPDSPRSLEACKREGVNPRELTRKSAADFAGPGVSTRIQQMRLRFYEQKRQERIRLVRRARGRISEKLYSCTRIAPGSFILPVGKLRRCMSTSLYGKTCDPDEGRCERVKTRLVNHGEE